MHTFYGMPGHSLFLLYSISLSCPAFHGPGIPLPAQLASLSPEGRLRLSSGTGVGAPLLLLFYAPSYAAYTGSLVHLNAHGGCLKLQIMACFADYLPPTLFADTGANKILHCLLNTSFFPYFLFHRQSTPASHFNVPYVERYQL